jgi:hypothetical protein
MAENRVHCVCPVLVRDGHVTSFWGTDIRQGRLPRVPGPVAAGREARPGARPRSPRRASRFARWNQGGWRVAALETPGPALIGPQICHQDQRHR